MTSKTKTLLITLVAVGSAFLVALVLLTIIPPTNKFLFVFQSVIMGRTNDEERCNIISPGSSFTGKFYTYHRNLALDGELDFVDGKVTGKWIRHDKNTGIIWWSGEYRANVAVGDWYWYSATTGVLESKEKGGGYYEGIGEEEFMLFGTTWSDVKQWVRGLFSSSSSP